MTNSGPGALMLALFDSLKAEPVKPQDAVTAALAMRYVHEIETGGDIARLGPALLSVLESLQMSPRSRAAIQRGANGVAAAPTTNNPLASLRAQRAGKNGTTHLHATTA